MSLLDWNPIENSRQGIAVSNRVQSKTIPLPLSEFENARLNLSNNSLFTICTLNIRIQQIQNLLAYQHQQLHSHLVYKMKD